jgi:hypothetical protein
MSFFFKTHFNIILSPTSRTLNLTFPWRIYRLVFCTNFSFSPRKVLARTVHSVYFQSLYYAIFFISKSLHFPRSLSRILKCNVSLSVMYITELPNKLQSFFIFVPCIIDYVEINQPNALKLYISLFFLTMAPTCFGKVMPSSGSDFFPVWATSSSIW